MTATGRRALDPVALRRKYPFGALVRPEVGLMERVTFLPTEVGAVDLEVAATTLGNLTLTFPHISRPDGGDVRATVMGGAGADVDAEQSWIRAVVEGAERYSTMVYSPSDFVVAPASELGPAALDLHTIPCCSDDEYSDPSCPLHPPDLDSPIRWVRGVSLVHGGERLVPAVMTHLYLKPWPAERFWLPISTGVAAHTHLKPALAAAICESIERDALALTWLLRLPLARIESTSTRSQSLDTLLDRLAQSTVRHHALDATSDVGVPTVMAVQVTEGHPHCRIFMSCATAVDAEIAFAKAIREASPARAVLESAPPCPADVRDFCEVTHGASYYGRGGGPDDFSFLLDTQTTTRLADVGDRALRAPGTKQSQELDRLIARLRSLRMEAIAVDLTADEVRDAGLWVVRVIVPDLVPISFIHRARYLGTSRLREQARRCQEAGQATEINPNPLPFA